MGSLTIIFFALILDRLIGDPDWLYRRVAHPVVIIGAAINWADRNMNQMPNQRAKGSVLTLALVLFSLVLGGIIQALPDFGVIELLVAFSLLAHRSLITHVQAVGDALRVDIAKGRCAVAQIVGRDTGQMDESDVCRAAIESAAENFSDGLIAGVFWYVVLGLPGLILYKAINTADSMIGHRNERYGAFGWAAAKLDDVLNYIPARLCGVLICLGRNLRHNMAVMWRDAALHRSPNAGWPESAMAATLNIALSGPRHYDGRLHHEPYINPDGRKKLMRSDIDCCVQVLNQRWVLLAAVLAGVMLLQWLL